MVRNGSGNRFRYEYKCRSASAPRFRLINTERSESSSVIVSPIIAADLVSNRADIAENLSITEREGNGIVATVGFRGLPWFTTSWDRFFRDFQVYLRNWITLSQRKISLPSIVGGWNVWMDGVEKFLTEWMAIFRPRFLSREKWNTVLYSLMQKKSKMLVI